MAEKYRIHAFYILMIMTTIIIVLATVRWAEIPVLADYITFGLTLASLILAILAIVYAYMSNASSAHSIAQLEAAGASVREAGSEVRQATSHFAAEVSTLRRSFDGLSGTVESTYSLVSSMAQVPTPGLGEKTEKPSATFIEQFVRACPNAGLLVLHACALAQAKAATLILSDVGARIRGTSEGYLLGFLIACRAARMIAFEMSGINAVAISAVPDELGKRLREQYMYNTQELKSPNFRRWAQEDLEAVEALITSMQTGNWKARGEEAARNED